LWEPWEFWENLTNLIGSWKITEVAWKAH
jgi:hypothetical protein